MRILIATPLYPPDIAPPAPYIKELATRLSAKHSVTVVTYGHLPEKIAGVQIATTSKRRALPLRLLAYTLLLWKNGRAADVIYTENGASTELPTSLVTLFLRKPLVLHNGDIAAYKRSEHTVLLRLIRTFACWVAHNVVTDIPRNKPEILPFEKNNEAAEMEYKNSWQRHIEILENIFDHYAK